MFCTVCCSGQNGISSGQRILGPQCYPKGAVKMPAPREGSTRAKSYVQGGSVMWQVLSAPRPTPSALHSYPVRLLPVGARPSSSLLRATVSPESAPAGTNPPADPQHLPLQVAQPQGMFYTRDSHRTFCDDGNTLHLCSPIW